MIFVSNKPKIFVSEQLQENRKFVTTIMRSYGIMLLKDYNSITYPIVGLLHAVWCSQLGFKHTCKLCQSVKWTELYIEIRKRTCPPPVPARIPPALFLNSRFFLGDFFFCKKHYANTEIRCFWRISYFIIQTWTFGEMFWRIRLFWLTTYAILSDVRRWRVFVRNSCLNDFLITGCPIYYGFCHGHLPKRKMFLPYLCLHIELCRFPLADF